MKFTKEEAFEELKRQLKKIVGDPAIKDRTIKEQIENLMPLIANDETELSDFVTKMLPNIKSIDGDVRKTNSDFVKKWETEHQPKNDPKGPELKDKEDSALQALLAKVEALEAREAERAKEVKISDARKQLKSKLKEKGVTDSDWINDILAQVTITEETDLDEKADACVKLYNRGLAGKKNPNPPLPAGGGEPRTEDFSDIKALFDSELKNEKNS